MKLILFSILVTMLGCAQKQLTLEEMDSALAVNKKEATRFYPNKTSNQVRKAAQQVLFLLDPPDMKFDIREDELLATRFSTLYAVFSGVFGRDWYSVTLSTNEQGTFAKIGMQGETNGGMIALPIPESYRSNIPVSAHNDPASLRLLHDRIEFFLEAKQEWPACKEALICKGLGIEDKPPTFLVKEK